MSLRPLLSLLDQDPAGVELARDGGRAFVSQSMRPYMVGALARDRRCGGPRAPGDRGGG
jgi:hypothetical protein